MSYVITGGGCRDSATAASGQDEPWLHFLQVGEEGYRGEGVEKEETWCVAVGLVGRAC